MAALPRGACDAHLHIIPEADATAMPRYRAMRNRLGLSRAVVVQAKAHGTDNTATLAAVAALGPGARGIGVVTPDVTNAELRRMNEGGIRGLRFSLWNPADAVVKLEWLQPLASRIAPLGWHVQIHMGGAQILELAPLLDRLPCPIVFDHMGRPDPARGPDDPVVPAIIRMLHSGRAWLKIGGAYLNTRIGPPDYPDAGRIARAYIEAAPDRLVWGTDWPHVTEGLKADDDRLLALLGEWTGSTAVRDRILVDNPATLYGFTP